MDILKKLEKGGRAWFNDMVNDETRDAQKKFGFQINTGKTRLRTTKQMLLNMLFYLGISAITMEMMKLKD